MLCIGACGRVTTYGEYREFIRIGHADGWSLTEINGGVRGCYTPIHEVTPKVVAMAVSTVMMMLMIFPQMFLFSIVFLF